MSQDSPRLAKCFSHSLTKHVARHIQMTYTSHSSLRLHWPVCLSCAHARSRRWAVSDSEREHEAQGDVRTDAGGSRVCVYGPQVPSGKRDGERIATPFAGTRLVLHTKEPSHTHGRARVWRPSRCFGIRSEKEEWREGAPVAQGGPLQYKDDTGFSSCTQRIQTILFVMSSSARRAQGSERERVGNAGEAGTNTHAHLSVAIVLPVVTDRGGRSQSHGAAASRAGRVGGRSLRARRPAR